MELNINFKRKMDPILLYVINRFPCDMRDGLLKFIEEECITSINEIRVHANSNISLYCKSLLIDTPIYTSNDKIEKIVVHLCGGSLYAHMDNIKEGYISIGNGVRAGVCGRAVLENGEITGVTEISSIILRIPQKIPFAGDYIFSFLKSRNFHCSVLIYSSPGVGKTTILRDLVCKLSGLTSLRFSVIDTREEITTFLNPEELTRADVFLAYPKGLGIELATKSMTPKIIICDEISSIKEADAVVKALHSGVSIIATTHAESFTELSSKAIFKLLFGEGVFDYAIGISRCNVHPYTYELNKLK